MNTNCKCGHSIFDHSEDIGCDAKGCTCSEGFENTASEIFTKAETEIDNLYREVNLLKVINHRLRTENDNEHDNALEKAASWITDWAGYNENEEIKKFSETMAMSIRAQKRGLTKRALDVCPSCAGSGYSQNTYPTYVCSACHGAGTRQ